MLAVVADLGIEEDDQGLHQLRVVDQMGGPQTLLPQLAQFQPADTPERLERFLARLGAYPAYMAANAEILREGLASGLTAPRIVAERTIAQLERLLAIPIEEAVIAVHGRASPPTRIASGSATSSASTSTRPTRRSSTRSRASTWPRPGRTRGSGRRPTARRSTGRRSGLDDARPRPAGGPPDRARGAREIEAERRTIAQAAGLRQRHQGVPRGAGRRSRQHAARPREALVERATEDIERGDGRRAAVLRPAAAGRLRGPAGRGVQGAGRAVRLLLPAVVGRIAARDLLRQRATTCHRGRTRKLATTTYHEAVPGPPLPDRPRDGEPEPQHVPAARLADGRRRLRRGLGPLQRAAGRRDGPLPRTRASGSGCSTRWPGGPPGSSSTPASMPSAGRASSRSTSCSRPA